MSKKTFLLNLKKRKFYNLKLINKEILNKSYIRDFLEEHSNVKLIDTYSSVSDLILKEKEGKKYNIGASVKTQAMLLKHKYWDKIQLDMPFLLKPKEKDICTILRNAKVAKVGLTNFNKKNKKKEEPKKEIIIQIDYTNHILDFINDKDIRIREDWITFESNHFNTWEEEKKFFLKQHSKWIKHLDSKKVSNKSIVYDKELADRFFRNIRLFDKKPPKNNNANMKNPNNHLFKENNSPTNNSHDKTSIKGSNKNAQKGIIKAKKKHNSTNQDSNHKQ